MAVNTKSNILLSAGNINEIYDFNNPQAIRGARNKFAIGTRAVDEDNREYIWLPGVTGLRKGMFVTFNGFATAQGANFMQRAAMNTAEDQFKRAPGATTDPRSDDNRYEDFNTKTEVTKLLSTANSATTSAFGNVAVAMGYGTQVADAPTKCGWFLVKGQALCRAAAAGVNTVPIASATAGVASNAGVGTLSAQRIMGAYFLSANPYTNTKTPAETHNDGAGNNLALVSLNDSWVG